MELSPPKNKSSTGGLGEGFVPHTYSQSLSTENSSEAQGWSVYYCSFGWSQTSGVSAVVVARDVATTGHKTVIRQQLLSGSSSLGWVY